MLLMTDFSVLFMNSIKASQNSQFIYSLKKAFQIVVQPSNLTLYAF